VKALILVFIGGGSGSIANSSNNGIPYGTFAANILGSLLIGIILGWALKNNSLSSQTTLLVATGFCGGLTFAFYAITTFTVGIIAVFGGMELAKLL